uniref:exodeoxyribonuclease III n=1 Tax=Leptobrachium leishanense TaxID=445787 RepID=A0A8C5MBQ6_9ANUR
FPSLGSRAVAGTSLGALSVKMCTFHILILSAMLKILSYNVKGLNAPVKRHSLAADVLRLKPDVVCLQETHFKRLAHPPLRIRNFSTQYHATGPTKARGVSILIRSDVVYQLHRKISDPQGRYLILVCSLNHKTYTLVNVYSPNTEQLSFISGVLNRVFLVATGVLLICGDLNYSIDPLRDVRSPKIPIPTKRSIRQGQKLRDLFSSHGLYDVWRLWHPGDSEFTFHSRVHNTYSRLDYFLLQGSSLSQMVSARLGYESYPLIKYYLSLAGNPSGGIDTLDCRL